MDRDDKTVHWGVLGTGFAATHFATGLAALPGMRVAAVASRTKARALAFAQGFGAAAAYDRDEQLLSDPGVDIVYVASENHRHREHCLAAFAAGKAVLCEKPMAMNAAEAAEIIGAARAADRFCMEALRTPLLPVLARAQELIRSGEIGVPNHLHAALGHRIDYRPGSRFYDPAQGGGALLDLGVYPVSLAMMLFGVPRSVKAGAVLTASGVDAEFSATLGFEQDRLATVSASIRAALPEGATLSGSSGRIVLGGPIYALGELGLERYPAPAPGGDDAPAAPGLARKLRASNAFRSATAPIRPWVRALKAHRRLHREYLPEIGNGFAAAAAEAGRCIRLGLRESPVFGLDQSLALMRCLDRIRHEWALVPASHPKTQGT